MTGASMDKYQRGELSLFWAAALVGVVTLGAVAALLSMRHERNLFDEAWQRLRRTDAGQSLRRTVENTGKSESAAIRKCIIGGKVMYSNVECDNGNPTSRQVELHDTRGVELPKAPPAPEPYPGAPETPPEKMVERAAQH